MKVYVTNGMVEKILFVFDNQLPYWDVELFYFSHNDRGQVFKGFDLANLHVENLASLL